MILTKSLFLSLVAFCFLLPAFHLFTDQSPLTFKYAFLYQSTDSPDPQTVAYNAISTELSAGDKLKIYLKPIRNAYIYLYFHDTSGGLYLLFPSVLSDFDGFYKLNKNYYIPGGDDWFLLDDSAGTDKFYLLVSAARLTHLENLTTTYLDYLYSTAPAADELQSAKQAVIEELKTLRLAHGQADSCEAPVLVACDFRGMGDIYEFGALEVETDGFYSKTIRIEHQKGKE